MIMNKVNIFLIKKHYDFMGWQTVDIYQNLNITYLTSIKTNLEIDNDLFKLPTKQLNKNSLFKVIYNIIYIEMKNNI